MPTDPQNPPDLHALALQKMTAVLGRARARTLMDQLLGELGIEVRTPQDLFALSKAMTDLRGFEGAVGAMLGVIAVLHGASNTAKSERSAS